MGIQFDWHEGDEQDKQQQKQTTKDTRHFIGGWWLVVAGVLLVGVLGVWFAGKKQTETVEAKLKSRITTILDIEQQAIETGSGDLFMSVQVDDPAWLVAQLRPEQIAFNHADRTVTRATQLGDEVWANVQWQENGETYQRLLFFQEKDGGLKHAGNADIYWESQNGVAEFVADWGLLQMPEGDQIWDRLIADRVSEMVAEICKTGCSDNATKLFALKITSSYDISVFNTHVQLPSPRLLGLDNAGNPALPFWTALEKSLTTYLKPNYIRFAVPLDKRINNTIEYVRLSQLFMVQNPGVFVEIVAPNLLPSDPHEWLKLVDGAALPPTQALITAGLVHDLTPFVNIDPDFDQGDFYEQVWQGAWWQERMWFMPTSANINLLYYDKAMFEEAGIEPLRAGMTWVDFTNALAQLQAHTATPEMPAVFLDDSNDMLYSYAYSWQGCNVGPCMEELNAGNIIPTLNWYQQLTTQNKYLIDLSHVPDEDRDLVTLRLTSAFREIGVWVDLAMDYETQVSLSRIGIVPFPANERAFAIKNPDSPPNIVGVSPLRLDGHIMSQYTTNAYWTWQWLKFLSYHSSAPRFRHIPARPSVARDTNYWRILPPVLGEPIQTAFSLARPILIGEEDVFSWSLLAALADGEVGVENAGNQSTQTNWFGTKDD